MSRTGLGRSEAELREPSQCEIRAEHPSRIAGRGLRLNRIVLSEVLYYFSIDDIPEIANRTITSLMPQVAGESLTPLTNRREPQYHLDLLLKPYSPFA
jgi:hypothetical protein